MWFPYFYITLYYENESVNRDPSRNITWLQYSRVQFSCAYLIIYVCPPHPCEHMWERGRLWSDWCTDQSLHVFYTQFEAVTSVITVTTKDNCLALIFLWRLAFSARWKAKEMVGGSNVLGDQRLVSLVIWNFSTAWRSNIIDNYNSS